MKKQLTKYSLVLLCSLWSTFMVVAKEPPPPPNPPRLVNDFANTLSPQEIAALEQKLVAYDDSTSTQIAIVLENSLDGDDIFDYSFRLAEKWGIGRAEKDNGILIYVALGDRKLYIQTGYGAEGFLPDAMAKRIIDQVIVPAFRQQQYFQGLDRATHIIMQLGSGEYTNDSIPGGASPLVALVLIVVFIVIIIVISAAVKGGGFYRGGRYDSGGGWLIFGPGWDDDGHKHRKKRNGGGFGGFGGGGFGGGGFGGFGGGGFGGGGAGGSW